MTFLPKLNGVSRQIIAGCSASLSSMGCSTIFAWLTTSLPIFLSPDGDIPMTSEDASWMVTMPQFGNLLSPIPAGMLADHFGRKPLILTSGSLVLAGWALFLYFKTLLALNVARVVQGIGVGIVYTVVPTYLGEIAAPKFRGMVASTFLCFWWFGFIYEYMIGLIFSFWNFTYLTTFTNVIFLATFVWQPESPYYYLLQNDDYKAKKSLSWFLGKSEENVNADLVRMKNYIEEEKVNEINWTDLIINPINRKCLLMLLLIGFLCVSCGLVDLSSYSTLTLTIEGDPFILSPKEVTMIMGVMMFLGTVFSFFVIDWFGRKPLLFFSCFSSGMCMLFIGTFYLLKSHSSLDVSLFTWVPPVGLIIFSTTTVIGIYPVSIAYTSELFDTSTRATAACISALSSSFIAIFQFKLYLPILYGIGTYANFYIYATVCFFGAILACTVMPETKGKSIEEIRLELQKK